MTTLQTILAVTVLAWVTLSDQAAIARESHSAWYFVQVFGWGRAVTITSCKGRGISLILVWSCLALLVGSGGWELPSLMAENIEVNEARARGWSLYHWLCLPLRLSCFLCHWEILDARVWLIQGSYRPFLISFDPALIHSVVILFLCQSRSLDYHRFIGYVFVLRWLSLLNGQLFIKLRVLLKFRVVLNLDLLLASRLLILVWLLVVKVVVSWLHNNATRKRGKVLIVLDTASFASLLYHYRFELRWHSLLPELVALRFLLNWHLLRRERRWRFAKPIWFFCLNGTTVWILPNLADRGRDLQSFARDAITIFVTLIGHSLRLQLMLMIFGNVFGRVGLLRSHVHFGLCLCDNSLSREILFFAWLFLLQLQLFDISLLVSFS